MVVCLYQSRVGKATTRATRQRNSRAVFVVSVAVEMIIALIYATTTHSATGCSRRRLCTFVHAYVSPLSCSWRDGRITPRPQITIPRKGSIRIHSTTQGDTDESMVAEAQVTDDKTTTTTATTTTETVASPVTPIDFQFDMDDIIGLCKRRGLIFPSSEIYNGYAGFYDYGPIGVELKRSVKDFWWKTFVTSREDVVGLDSSIIHNPTTWKSSGTSSTVVFQYYYHIFSKDPMVKVVRCIDPNILSFP
jgi:hypothetical protein